MINNSKVAIKLPLAAKCHMSGFYDFALVLILQNKSDVLFAGICKMGVLICHSKVKGHQVQRLSVQNTWACAALQDTAALRWKYRISEHN